MTEPTKNPAPPKDLSRESSRWWRSVVESYELRPHHLKLLTLAARTWDRGEAARRALAENGLTYSDAHGVRRPAPETVIEKNCAIAFARLLRELRLDASTMEDDDNRIPRNR